MNEIKTRAIKTQLPLILEMISETQNKVTDYKGLIEDEVDMQPLISIYKEMDTALLQFYTRLHSLNEFYFKREENNNL